MSTTVHLAGNGDNFDYNGGGASMGSDFLTSVVMMSKFSSSSTSSTSPPTTTTTLPPPKFFVGAIDVGTNSNTMSEHHIEKKSNNNNQGSINDYTLDQLVLNHGLVIIVGFILLAFFAIAAALLYLAGRQCRRGSGQLMLFLYSLSIAAFALLVLFGFHQPNLAIFPESRLNCVVVSVASHSSVLLSFGILACYGAHLIYRIRPRTELPNLFVMKSVLPTVGLSIAIPIALCVVRPDDYLDNFACCFPQNQVATYAIFLPIALVTLSNVIILFLLPFLYDPKQSSCCRKKNYGKKLDWSPVYEPERTPFDFRIANAEGNNQTTFSEIDSNNRPSCLHALAVIGLCIIEAGLVTSFYLANFSDDAKKGGGKISTVLPYGPTTKTYHTTFLVMAFLLGISVLLEMATLEDHSLAACK